MTRPRIVSLYSQIESHCITIIIIIVYVWMDANIVFFFGTFFSNHLFVSRLCLNWIGSLWGLCCARPVRLPSPIWHWVPIVKCHKKTLHFYGSRVLITNWKLFSILSLSFPLSLSLSHLLTHLMKGNFDKLNDLNHHWVFFYYYYSSLFVSRFRPEVLPGAIPKQCWTLYCWWYWMREEGEKKTNQTRNWC